MEEKVYQPSEGKFIEILGAGVVGGVWKLGTVCWICLTESGRRLPSRGCSSLWATTSKCREGRSHCGERGCTAETCQLPLFEIERESRQQLQCGNAQERGGVKKLRNDPYWAKNNNESNGSTGQMPALRRYWHSPASRPCPNRSSLDIQHLIPYPYAKT